MKIKISFLIIIFSIFFSVFANAQGSEFITVWKTDIPTVPASPNTQIVFPGLGGNYTIRWEEQGNPANNGSLTGNDATLIDFGSVGTYIVKVTPGAGSFTGLEQTESRLRLTGLTQWGTAVVWQKLEYGFSGCENLDITATDIPVFDASLTSLEGLFSNCTSLVWNASVNDWALSNITNLSSTFRNATLFNQPLNKWNVSNVTTTNGLFYNADSFNQPLNDWDVRKLGDATLMFWSAAAFNQPLDQWELSSIQQFGQAFIYFTSMSCVNYSKTLIGWANNPNTRDNSNGDFGIQMYTDLFYGNNGAIARDALIAKGWTIMGDTFDPACDATLPVGFGNISAILRGSTLWVNWTTLSETNNSSFNIEISKDGKNFTAIGEMKSKAVDGNSSTTLDYSFSTKASTWAVTLGVLVLLSMGVDFIGRGRKAAMVLVVLGLLFVGYSCSKRNEAGGIDKGDEIFVRIAQVDKDGKKQYSKVVQVVKEN